MLKLGYKELFIDLEFEDQYPIEKFAVVIPKLIGTSRDIIHLDFSGIDVLSDEVFFVLRNELKIAQKQNVEIINLTGCCQITDRGIEILAQSFSNLKELIVVGCLKLTQLSLNFLMENCPKLEKLSAQFTRIAYLSNVAANKWSDQSLKCNPLFKEDETQDVLSMNLVVLVMDTTIQCDIGHYLATGKLKDRQTNQPIVFQPNALNINQTNINIIQLFCPTVYMAPFICDRSLFVIATDMESNTNNAFNIIKGLDFIRGVAYCCPIQILVFTSSTETKKLEELTKILKSIFADQHINTKEHLDQEHYSKSCDKDFVDQWRYVQSLSAIDPDHFSLHLLGVSKRNSDCQMCYCAAICEPSTSAKIEQTIAEFYDNYVSVKDSLDRINKSDIDEIKSYPEIPPEIVKIIQTINKLLSKKETVEEFLSDPLLLAPLRNYDSLSDDDNPDHSLSIIKEEFLSKQDLKKHSDINVDMVTSSRGMKLSKALGLWILAKWDLCEKLVPLKNRLKEFESLSQTRNDVKTTFELISLNLHQNFIQLSKYMYKHLPSKSTPAMRMVTEYIINETQPIIKVDDIAKELKELSKMEICLVFDQIQTTGKIISISHIGMAIINVEWFINTVNMILTRWDSPLNQDRVWFITPEAVLSSMEDLESILSDQCVNELFKNLLTILQFYGLILSVRRSWYDEPQEYETEYSTETPNKTFYLSWHQLSLQPHAISNLFANELNTQLTESSRTLNDVFPDYHSPEFNSDDLSFKFSFKFRIGIPSNLFCQVVGKLTLYYWPILLWSQGILIRNGSAEVLILHNIHASRGSSSFDIECRIRGPVEGRRPVAVREHMWSFLSEIITIIEAFIVEYPHLHHKVRHYCRGECFKELGLENTFAEAQVSRNLNCNYYCSKCREFQMSQSDWLYILGRHLVLPNHDFDKNNTKSCMSCWKRRLLLDYLWKSQQKIFPIFTSKLLHSKKCKYFKGNLIMSGTEECLITTCLKCGPHYLRMVEFKVLDPTGTRIVLSQKFNSSETEIFCWNLENGHVTTVLSSINSNEHQEDTKWNMSLHTESSISLHFLTDEIEINTILIKKDEDVISQFSLKNYPNVYLSLKLAPNNSESEKLQLIVSATDAGIVTASHFRPGMIVLLKGERKWEPAVISSITNGKLNCQPLSMIDGSASSIPAANNQLLSIHSTNILPPGFYPSKINSTLDSRNQKSLAESWYKVFSEYSEYTPAPFGLFPRLVDKPSYLPLPIFGLESRECISSAFCPEKVLKLMFTNKPVSSRTSTSYIPLPFPFTPLNLLIPQRQIISQNNNHALHKLCPGNLWRNYIRDMHPLNKEPYHMSAGESKYFFNGDFILDVFVIIKTFTSSFSAIYQNIDQCFPLINPNINKDLLRDAVIAICRAYRDVIWFEIIAKIPMYNSTIMYMDKSAKQLFSSITNTREKTKKKVTAKYSERTDLDSVKQSPWTEDEMGNIVDMFQKKQNVCRSHELATNIMHISDLGPYCQCVVNIILKNSDMDYLNDSALESCTKLRKLEINFGTMMDISWILSLPRLSSLTLTNCGLREIGKEIDHLRNSLKQLSLDGNPIREIPDSICTFPHITSLQLNNTLISQLPRDIGKLRNLRYLSIEHTKLNSLPDSFAELKNLTTLKLSGVAPPKIFLKKSQVSMKDWRDYCNQPSSNMYLLVEEDIFNMFETFTGGDEIMNSSKIDEFRLALFNKIPRFKEFPIQILGCTSLQALIFPHQAFEIVPDEIQNLVNLKSFVVDGCMNLHTLSSYLGTLPLEVLSLQNCDTLKTPPCEIRKQGMRNTIAYLLRLVSGSEACYRTKLMLVGLGGAGKTSLMRALTSKDFRAPQLAEEAITDGIDINSWSTKQDGDITLQFSVWDFAGQTLYYNTHQFYLTGRSVYLLIWNLRQGFEHAGLDFWLNSICCHAPMSPIFIVGTHSDKVDKSEIPTSLYQSRYPSIAGFFFVSSLSGKGMKELHDRIIEETIKQPYIGEIVPKAWLRLEKDLISQRNTADYLNWEAVVKLARNNAIYGAETSKVIRFLHDLGNIQYFDFPLLKDFVIINSQWLVDVMACVVSVKNSIIENGKLDHFKVRLVWPKYPESIHTWLLRLTEIFDLTFSVPGQNFNFIPCLLPNEPPEFQWPDYVDFTQIRESNMFYQFEYLPPGLFNRAQVRLSQFSDTFIIWQHGSLLNKDGDRALMKKLNDTTVKICARGYWPDNILFIIHEMFETLISEAFSGVKYEYQISCKKCVSERDGDPYLFSKSVLQRAIQSKTVFVQCHRNFHITTMAEIQESTPPDAIEDYDLQFKKSVNLLSSNLQPDFYRIMVLVSDNDFHDDSLLLNTPKRIVADLMTNQYSVWCEPLIEGTPEDVYIDTLTRAEIVISIISGNFTNNKPGMALFKLAKITLRKNMILVQLDKGYTEGSLGLETAGDKYINFERTDLYDHKFQDLLHDLQTQMEERTIQAANVRKPRVFISYCWDNSQRSFATGRSKVIKESAIGWGDPRDIKDYIEQRGLSCWLDIEMIGLSSIYSEITSGLRSSEIVVACLSTEVGYIYDISIIIYYF